MLKEVTIKGMTLGLIAGLIVTFFDGLFMFCRNTYIPIRYPFFLLTFNIIFWVIIGCAASTTLWFYVRRKSCFREKEVCYWVIFFLIPFSLVYGILGRYTPSVYNLAPSAFDKNMSFVWVCLILFCQILFF